MQLAASSSAWRFRFAFGRLGDTWHSTTKPVTMHVTQCTVANKRASRYSLCHETAKRCRHQRRQARGRLTNGMNVETLIAEGALGPELARLRRMEVRTTLQNQSRMRTASVSRQNRSRAPIYANTTVSNAAQQPLQKQSANRQETHESFSAVWPEGAANESLAGRFRCCHRHSFLLATSNKTNMILTKPIEANRGDESKFERRRS